jgi:exo-1,4-beta-D-glucosaminidase
MVSRNIYWLSSRPARFDWGRRDYRYSPMLEYPDLTALRAMARARISARAERQQDVSVALRLRNVSKALAFQLRLDALDARGRPVLPALWTDNYIEIFPGEEQTVTVRPAAHGGTPVASIALSGWNVAGQRLVVAAGADGAPPPR